MSFNPVSSSEQGPIYYSSTRMDGTGLWVQPSTRNSGKPAELPPKPPKKPRPENIYTAQVKALEKKYADLAGQVDEEQILHQQALVEQEQIGQRIMELEVLNSHLMEQLYGVQGKAAQLEEGLEEVSMQTQFKQAQVAGLEEDIENERAKAETYKSLYDKEVAIREEERMEYEQELQVITEQIEQLNQEQQMMEEFIKSLEEENESIKKQKSPVKQTKAKVEEEPEDQEKEILQKLHGLMADNRNMLRQIQEQEDASKRNQEIIQSKETELQFYIQENQSLLKRLKTERDMRKAQSTLIEDQEKRLKIVKEERKKHIIKVKKAKQQTQEIEEVRKLPSKPKGPTLKKVEARPDLFDD